MKEVFSPTPPNPYTRQMTPRALCQGTRPPQWLLYAGRPVHRTGSPTPSFKSKGNDDKESAIHVLAPSLSVPIQAPKKFGVISIIKFLPMGKSYLCLQKDENETLIFYDELKIN
jgi:hypothetical protein